MAKRLQNRIAESRLTLPVTSVIMLALWLAGGLVEKQLYVRLALVGASTYLMMELNNRNALIRTYSRMVSCSFLALTTMAAFAFRSVETLGVQACMIMVYAILFSCYQDKTAYGKAFYAFFFLSVASTFFIQILFFIPFLWIFIRTNMMAFSIRILWSSLIGLLVPYWFLACYHVFNGDISLLVTHVSSIAQFSPLWKYDNIDEHRLATFVFVTLISITGTIHFLRNSYKDKIRTRRIYEMLMMMNVLILLFIILQPQHIEELSALMIIHAGVLVAHFITLTNTKITNIAFYVLLSVWTVLTVYNIWMPSLKFL